VLLVALIPLLWIEADFSRLGAKGCWKYYALTFLLWNILTTWWIWKATQWGSVVAIVGNAFVMFVMFALFRLVKKKTGDWIGYIFLITIWIAWEYFSYDAELSWPWLVLGSGFSETTFLVQWYEYTGVLGGTLWIFLANIFVFKLIKERKRMVITAAIVLLPALTSLIRFYTYTEKSNPIEVVVLQPNINPYNEKFEDGSKPLSQEEQDLRLLAAAQQAVRQTTRYVFAPETAISSVEEGHVMFNASIVRIYQFLQEYPHVTFVTGATSTLFYTGTVAPTKTARQRGGSWYDIFNAAFQLSIGETPLVYHKSKLVPGAEKVPYAKYLKLANKLLIDLGGAFGSFGTQPESTVFPAPWDKNFKIGVAICYESVYGAYFASYVKKGAGFMAVITNDGWWGNSPGYRQHLSYSRLRAIETRRCIARSANTGISAFVNQRGDYMQKSKWWTQDWLREEININHKLTFYTRHGDLIGRLSIYLLVFLLLYWLTLFRFRR